MKKQLLTFVAIFALPFLLTNCSDDDNGSNPDNNDDVTYYNSNIEFYTYDEYDLDTENKEVAGTRHQDSLMYTQKIIKDGKNSTEYKVHTNSEGSYMEDGDEYYAGEKNKLYAHQSVFQGMFANIESNGFSLATLFDDAGDWFLIADAKATEPWVLFDGAVDVAFPTGDLTIDSATITMANATRETLEIEGSSVSVDKYSYTVKVKGSTFAGEIDFNVTGVFWVAADIGIVKSNVNSFAIPVGSIEVKGTERILVNHNVLTIRKKSNK